MRKIFDNFIKVTIINKFSGDKRIEVASGEQSEGVLVLSSSLGTKAVDISKNLNNPRSKQFRPLKKAKNVLTKLKV